MKQRKEIMRGVYLTHLPATKFKTNCLSVHLIMPLKKETASMNALLPAVLRRGTSKHPNMESISEALDILYGAQIESSIRKKGERQCIGFVANCIDDNYTPNGEKLLEGVVDLVGELLLSPLVDCGAFSSDYVESEKINLIDGLKAIRNDKRDWADVRLMQEMCKDEPYGVLRFGDVESVQSITASSLFVYFQSILATSRIEFIFCGSANEEYVEKAIINRFQTLPRKGIEALPNIVLKQAPNELNYVEETMDVTQGKLSMGWRCSTEDIPAMIIANLIFGGTSNSKLFLNVREKMSLCYYASSSFARSKGIVTVSSGIETKDYQAATDEIFHQLDLVKSGSWEDWEFDGALAMMRSSLTTLYDSQGALENYTLGNIVTDLDESPEELNDALNLVTKERVMNAAKSMKIDTIYFLKGTEDQ